MSRYRDKVKALPAASLVAVMIVIVQAILLTFSSCVHSPVIQEYSQVIAGLSHWQFGRFDLLRVNPPLVRLLASLPVHLVSGDKEIDWSLYSDTLGDRPEERIASRMEANTAPAVLNDVRIARVTCILITLTGSVVCYLWSRDLFGEPGGLISLCLWSFSPLVLGYGCLILADIGGATFTAMAGYSFSRWLKQPNLRSSSWTGLAVGLAIASKLTCLILVIVLPLLWTLSLFGLKLRWFLVIHRGLLLGLSVIIAICVVNIVYGFEKSFQRLEDYSFISELFGGRAVAEGVYGMQGNRFTNTEMAGWRLPLPANFVLGIDTQRSHFERKLQSYFRGSWVRGGWHFYYPYLMAIRLPLATIGLIVLAVLPHRAKSEVLTRSAQGMVPLIIAAAVLLLLITQNGFSRHARYLLPALPGLYVWLGTLGSHWYRKHVLMRKAIIALVVWATVSSLWIYPHSLSFFNELVGGPLFGLNYLAHSNIDSGQDLLYMDKWLHEDVLARPVYIQVADNVTLPDKSKLIHVFDANKSQTDTQRERTTCLSHGWHVVSVTELIKPGGRYWSCRSMQPSFEFGYSLRVYHIVDNCDSDLTIVQERK